MVQKSTLFLENVTAIDYAFLDPIDNTPQGRSLQLSVMVSGRVDEHEAVVVDFSKIKKTIKAIIDDNDHGFDHKLWVPEDYNTHHPQIEVYEDDGEIEIVTPKFRSICPTNAIRFTGFIGVSSIEKSITNHLETELRVVYPNIGIKVKATVCEDMWIPKTMRDYAMSFCYVHGLKNSSSWGCQNINHGHLSWLAICNKDGNGLFIPTDFYSRLRREIHNAYFVWDENILKESEDTLTIGYHCDRGYFECEYNKDANIRIITTDTTVENLAQWFVNTYRDELTSGELKEMGAHSVYLSEGLTKGAYIEI